MNCSICGKSIGDQFKVRMWNVQTKKPVEYHRACWNKKVADILRWEDDARNKRIKS